MQRAKSVYKDCWSLPAPRPYQAEGIEEYFRHKDSGLCRLPTGMGKTILSSAISLRQLSLSPHKILFLAHTKQLVRQAALEYMRFGIWPNIERGIYRGKPFVPTMEERRKLFGDDFPPNDWFHWNRVIIGTYQSFIRRQDEYADTLFDLFIIDEAHRSQGRSYQIIAQRLREQNPDLRVLGLTATPRRTDKKKLSLFNRFYTNIPIHEGIDQGWLVDVRAKKAKIVGDFSELKRKRTAEGESDFSDEELAQVMKQPEVIESIAKPIIEFGENRRGIIFTCGQDVSEILCDQLNLLEPGCACFVHGNVSDELLDERIKDFKAGKYRLIVGCQMLVEGFDVPDISLVVMARLTGSRTFYEQCLGRGLRIVNNCVGTLATPSERREAIAKSEKKDAMILDFCNNTTRHKLVNCEDIILGGDTPEIIDLVQEVSDNKPLRQQIEEAKAIAELREALKDVDLTKSDVEWEAEEIEVFDGGTRRDKGKNLKNSEVAGQKLKSTAYDLFIDNADRYTADALQQKIEEQKNRVCGRRNWGNLHKFGLSTQDIKSVKPNWFDADFLRKLFHANKEMPADWKDKLNEWRKR